MTEPDDMVGELQAIRRAGPWPVSGPLEAYRAATERAAREARRTQDIEYRWNTRFRLWERRVDERAGRQITRLASRRRLAIEIAEEREWLLRRLCGPARGSA